MKKLALLLAMAGLLLFTTSAFALGDNNNSGIQGDKNHHNTIINGDGNNSPTNVRQCNVNHNHNVNCNRNSNLNWNTNRNENFNAQAQGQLQGQLQGQSQVGIVDNDIVIKNPVSYNHFAPEIGKTDADLLDHENSSDVRTITSIFEFDDDDFITFSESKSASKGADIDVIKSVLWEGKNRLDTLNYVDVSGKYMGSLTLTTEDATLDQVLARAAKEAMLLGATSIAFVTKDAKKVSATKYGIDFGSSASVAAKADGSIIIAPGATLGWSKAVASNIVVGEVYVALFRDDSLIIPAK